MPDRDKQEYYIVCNRHRKPYEYNWTFWRPNKNGYTYMLEEAGLYSPSDKPNYPILTEENRKNRNIFEDFLIHKKDLHLIGVVYTGVYMD